MPTDSWQRKEMCRGGWVKLKVTASQLILGISIVPPARKKESAAPFSRTHLKLCTLCCFCEVPNRKIINIITEYKIQRLCLFHIEISILKYIKSSPKSDNKRNGMHPILNMGRRCGIVTSRRRSIFFLPSPCQA